MRNEKFYLNFTRTVNNIFDPWELSKFINDFGNEYYKLDLIRSISLELKNGTLPENIIIMNNPIKRKYINNEYFDLNDSSMLNSFQSIGYPISLYPNKNIVEIALFIRLYKKLNSILNKNISRNVLLLEFQTLKKHSFKQAINNLEEEALNKLNKNSGSFIKANIIDAKNTIEEIYIKFNNQEESIEEYINKFNENLEEDIVITESLKEYFYDFFTYFMKLSKPLIGVYNEEEQKIRVICINHLRKRKKGVLPELDFRKYGHNSPPFFEIGTEVATIGKTIYDAKKEQEVRDEIIKTEKMKQQLLEKQIQVEEARLENLDLNNQLLKAKLNSITNETLDDESLVKEVASIPNLQIKNKMTETYLYQMRNTTQVLKRNKLVLSENVKGINLKA